MDNDDIDAQVLNVTISGTGFAADYTAQCYRQIPHKNGLWIELAGVASGTFDNAKAFAQKHDVAKPYESHAEMVQAVAPDIDNIACANYAHGSQAIEAAKAGASIIVLEKPPVIWPGYAENREADASTRKRESMDYLRTVIQAVRDANVRLLYAEDFVYVDGVRAIVALLAEAMKKGKGRVLYQRGICAHQGSHAPAYDTPSKSGGGALFNKACHPLGPCLYLKQVEGIMRDGEPVRPVRVWGHATQILKHQPKESGEHFRVIQNVDDFGRITIEFSDKTIAEALGHDLSISGIHNAHHAITDFAQYDIRINPNNEHELFLPDPAMAGDLLMREKLPTPAGTSFPRPRQFHAHGYVNEIEDAVDCAMDADRVPQSGTMMAWDTMAVLMAAYESAENGGGAVDVTEYTSDPFPAAELPDPSVLPEVLQRL